MEEKGARTPRCHPTARDVAALTRGQKAGKAGLRLLAKNSIIYQTSALPPIKKSRTYQALSQQE